MNTGQQLAKTVARGALVLRMRVRVQEADRDRLDTLLSAGVCDRIELGHVERSEDGAVAVDALAHLEAEPSGHEGLRLPADEVVHVRSVPAADLEDVAEAAGRHERGAGALALRQRVDDDRRPVDQVPDLLERDGACRQAVEHALGEA